MESKSKNQYKNTTFISYPSKFKIIINDNQVLSTDESTQNNNIHNNSKTKKSHLKYKDIQRASFSYCAKFGSKDTKSNELPTRNGVNNKKCNTVSAFKCQKRNDPFSNNQLNKNDLEKTKSIKVLETQDKKYRCNIIDNPVNKAVYDIPLVKKEKSNIYLNIKKEEARKSVDLNIYDKMSLKSVSFNSNNNNNNNLTGNLSESEVKNNKDIYVNRYDNLNSNKFYDDESNNNHNMQKRRRVRKIRFASMKKLSSEKTNYRSKSKYIKANNNDNNKNNDNINIISNLHPHVIPNKIIITNDFTIIPTQNNIKVESNSSNFNNNINSKLENRKYSKKKSVNCGCSIF